MMRNRRTHTFEDVVFPVIVSPVIDGRGIQIIDGIVYQEKTVVKNKKIQRDYGLSELNGLIGVLEYIPTDESLLRDLDCVLTSPDIDDFNTMFHAVEDTTQPLLACKERILQAKRKVCRAENCTMIEYHIIYDLKNLKSYRRKCVLDGIEYIVVRDPYYKSPGAERLYEKVRNFFSSTPSKWGYVLNVFGEDGQ